jgi:phenylalanine ammonia-lyase
MKITVNGNDLSLREVRSVARCEEGASVSISGSAVRLMTESLALKRDMISSGRPIYGVTSGFGDSSTRQIHGEKSADLQGNLINFLHCGVGNQASPDVTRATILIRANCLARGYSGVRPEVVDLLLKCLQNDILPIIPERGSVGASGDLVPLSYVASMLIGQGDVIAAGAKKKAAEALAEAGLVPLALEAKEGLALVNGTSFMAAIAVVTMAQIRELIYVAELSTAMASQVLLGNPGHFSEFLFLQKPHQGVIDSAAAIRGFLARSADSEQAATPAASHRPEESDAAWASIGFRELPEAIQDRYSVRCAPHVIGALRDVLTWAEQQLLIEINSSNDNPLFDPETQSVMNGGNFYGSHVGIAMDALKTAVASVADLLDRQLELIVDEKFNNGLTPNLIRRVEPSDRESGLHHGFKGMQLTASALAAEALQMTTPATSFSRSTEAHNQDKVSMGTIAARGARTITDLAIEVAAIHLLALAQAADIRTPWTLSPLTTVAYDAVRQNSTFLTHDRALHSDISAMTESIRSGQLRRMVLGSRRTTAQAT